MSSLGYIAPGQNCEMAYLASATRTAQTQGPDVVNTDWKSAVVYLNITAASGTGGLKLALLFKDPVSGNYVQIGSGPGTAITATGLYPFVIYPLGANTLSTPGGASINSLLPSTFAIEIQHQDGSNYTYSVGLSLLRY